MLFLSPGNHKITKVKNTHAKFTQCISVKAKVENLMKKRCKKGTKRTSVQQLRLGCAFVQKRVFGCVCVGGGRVSVGDG